MRQTKGQTDHATEKCVAISVIAARAIPPNNSQKYTVPLKFDVNNLSANTETLQS